MKNRLVKSICITSLVALSGIVSAEEMADDVIIAPPKEGKIEEFRAQGRVYMIKVTPSKGKPYFLVDADGDGEFDVRRNELDPDLMIPSWVILKW